MPAKLPWIDAIVHGDCLSLMRKLPDASIPLVLTSPPYGRHDFDAELVFDEFERIVEPNGFVVWVEQDQVKQGRCSQSVFIHYELIRDAGFDLVVPLVMERAGHRCPQRGHPGAPEFAMVFSKGTPKPMHLIKDKPNVTAGAPIKHSVRDRSGLITYLKRTGKVVQPYGRRGSVWRYNSGFNNSSKAKYVFDGHPAIMPEAMAEDLIITFSRPGDLVLDPLAGSGTTAVMALLNHRRFLGFEIHQPYVELARTRVEWAKWEQQQRLDRLFEVRPGDVGCTSRSTNSET